MADQKPDVQQDSDRIKPELTPDRRRVRIRPARIHNAQMSNDQAPAFQPLTGVYEPSAIQQLLDGRFLVVEDEKSHPLSLITIGADGSVDTTALTALASSRDRAQVIAVGEYRPRLREVPGALVLRLHIARIERIDWRHQRDSIHDIQASTLQEIDLVRVVRQQPDA